MARFAFFNTSQPGRFCLHRKVKRGRPGEAKRDASLTSREGKAGTLHLLRAIRQQSIKFGLRRSRICFDFFIL